MRRTLVIAAAAVFVLLVQSPSVLSGQSNATGGSAHDVIGKVIDARSGSPLDGVTVRLVTLRFGNGQQSPGAQGAAAVDIGAMLSGTEQVLTGNDGTFRFAGVPDGNVLVTAQKTGWVGGGYGQETATAPARPLPVQAGVPALTLRMWRNGLVSGLVVDDADMPVPGMEVRAKQIVWSGGAAFLVDLASTRTVADGTYVLSDLRQGTYLIAAMGSSSPSASPFLQTRGGQAGPPQRRPGQVTGDGEGRLLGYGVTYYPSADAPGTSTAVHVKLGDQLSNTLIRVHRIPTGTVSGVILLPDRSPARARVALWPSQNDGQLHDSTPVADTQTDPSGHFALPTIPEGAYLLKVAYGATAPQTLTAASPQAAFSAPPTLLGDILRTGIGPHQDEYWAETRVVVDAATVEVPALTLELGFKIAGRLRMANDGPLPAGISKSAIVISRADQFPASALAQSLAGGNVDVQPDGTFVTTSFTPGKYYIRVPLAPAGPIVADVTTPSGSLGDGPINIERGDIGGVTLVLADQLASLSGNVRSSAGTLPDGATVFVYPADESAWSAFGPFSARYKRIAVGPNGSYAARGLPTGEYYVGVTTDDSSDAWQQPVFLKGLSQSAVKVHLIPGDNHRADLSLP